MDSLISSDEAAARAYFERVYLPEAALRCLFVVTERDEPVATATTWTEAVAKFYIPEPDVMYLRIVAPEGYWIDDLRVQEGNEGEGQEVVYSVGGDDGREFGYVYFQDDFSWVTEDLSLIHI